jgi:hypothetical protein
MSALVRWISEPGFYPDLDAGRYFQDPAPYPSVSQSWIKREAEASPYHAANDHPRLNPYGTRKGSKAAHLFLGDAVHRLALGKGREISIVRYPDYKSEAARNDRDAAIANNRIPILQRVHVQAFDMAELVRAKIVETLGGAPYETEVPIFWTEEVTLPSGRVVTVWCRGMLDVWCPSLAWVLDVKTMSGLASDEGIAKQIENNDYAVQGRFYPRGVERILPELAGRVKFDFLWIEAGEPYGHRATPLDGSTRHTGDLMVDMGLQAFAEGMASGVWPSYPQDGAPIGARSFYHQRIEARAAARGFQL